MTRRDFRRGLAWRWRLLEVEARTSIRLPEVWRRWYGVAPVFEGRHGAMSFIHFRSSDEERLLAILRPGVAEVPGATIAMACSLVATKYGCSARLARPHEVPALPKGRAPSAVDEEIIEEFPAGRVEGDAVIAEFALWPGFFIAPEQLHDPFAKATQDTSQAALLTPSEARALIAAARDGDRPAVVLRFLAGAVAEADQQAADELADML